MPVQVRLEVPTWDSSSVVEQLAFNQLVEGSNPSCPTKQKEMEMGKDRIPLKGGDEFDVLTKARKMYKYLERSKVAKKIKRKYNKRFRKHGKNEIQSGSQELE